MKNREIGENKARISIKRIERKTQETEREIQERKLMEQNCKLEKFLEDFKNQEQCSKLGHKKLSYANLVDESTTAAKLCGKLNKMLLDVIKWREVIGEGNYIAETRPLAAQAKTFVKTYKYFIKRAN